MCGGYLKAQLAGGPADEMLDGAGWIVEKLFDHLIVLFFCCRIENFSSYENSLHGYERDQFFWCYQKFFRYITLSFDSFHYIVTHGSINVCLECAAP